MLRGMTKRSSRLLLLAASFTSLIAISLSAQAQTVHMGRSAGSALKLQTMNFDLWCQETKKLPPERCDQRLAQDEEEFNTYRAMVERYEVPYLQDKERRHLMDRAIMRPDPVQNPVNHPLQPASPAP